MALSRDQIKRLGHLSRLELDDSSIDRLALELEGMTAMVAEVQEVDTTHVAGAVHVHAGAQPLREDTPAMPTCALASGAARSQDGFVVVPKTID